METNASKWLANLLSFGGGLLPRARYKLEGNIAAKHRASELEMRPGALLTGPPANLSRTYALPASTTTTESNLKNRPKRTAVRGRSPSALRHASIGATERPGQLRPLYHGPSIAVEGSARSTPRSWLRGRAPAAGRASDRKASRLESHRARRGCPGARADGAASFGRGVSATMGGWFHFCRGKGRLLARRLPAARQREACPLWREQKLARALEARTLARTGR
jgi:hypothetical protein